MITTLLLAPPNFLSFRRACIALCTVLCSPTVQCAKFCELVIYPFKNKIDVKGNSVYGTSNLFRVHFWILI